MEWWNAVDVYENSHSLHLKCASYMDVIEADDASDGIKVSDEALEVQHENTLNKHLKCVQRLKKRTDWCRRVVWIVL